MAPKCLASLILVVACALSLTMVSATRVITVGDEKGWTLGFDYVQWAATKEFHVGDTLVFNYGVGVHDVRMVDATAFANCVNEPNLGAYGSGEDRVVLNAEGNMWFICGVGAHCENGMKLKITVTEDSSYWSPAPAPATAPELPSAPYWTPSPPAPAPALPSALYWTPSSPPAAESHSFRSNPW